jgi:hypothetical protein
MLGAIFLGRTYVGGSFQYASTAAVNLFITLDLRTADIAVVEDVLTLLLEMD